MDVQRLPGGSWVVWRVTEWAGAAEAEMARRLALAAEEVRLRCRELLAEPAPPSSGPGGPPHADTGRLRDSVFASVDEGTGEATVGTPLRYGFVLEFGSPGGALVQAARGSVLSWVDPATGKRHYAKWVRLGPIRPRPWLRRGAAEAAPAVRAIFEQPFPDL